MACDIFGMQFTHSHGSRDLRTRILTSKAREADVAFILTSRNY